jgi:hypothetical protein
MRPTWDVIAIPSFFMSAIMWYSVDYLFSDITSKTGTPSHRVRRSVARHKRRRSRGPSLFFGHLNWSWYLVPASLSKQQHSKNRHTHYSQQRCNLNLLYVWTHSSFALMPRWNNYHRARSCNIMRWKRSEEILERKYNTTKSDNARKVRIVDCCGDHETFLDASMKNSAHRARIVIDCTKEIIGTAQRQ